MRPTCTSSSPARRAGRSKTASSRRAAPASSRAWACARWPARRPASRTPMKSCCRRSRKRRAPRAPSPSRGQERALQSVLPSSGHSLYLPIDPVSSFSFQRKSGWLERVDRETRKMDPRVVQVMASVVAVHEVVLVANSDGHLAADVRPLVRFNVSVIVEQNGRREQGYAGCGRALHAARAGGGRQAAGAGARGGAPGAGESRRDSRARGPDDRGARSRLARHPAARSHRSRPRGRFQSQRHVRVCGPNRRKGGLRALHDRR